MIRQVLRHPIAIISLFALMVFAGVLTLGRLPVELLPSLKFPRLVVITSFGNASSEEVESLLTRPVEEAVGTVVGLRSIQSVSSEGISTVILTFDWGADISLAAAEVREKLDLITDEFPREAKLPIVVQYDPTDAPIMTLALTGSTDLKAQRNLVEHAIKPELETVNGVASARPFGGMIPEIQVLVDQGRLSAYSMDLASVATALESANINFPGGRVLQGPHEIALRTVGRFKDVDEIARVSLGRGTSGATVRVMDLAEVKETSQDRTSISRVNRTPAVLMGIIKEPLANTIQVSNNVQEKLKDITRTLPPGAKLEVVDDEAPFVRKAVSDLRGDALIGAFLAFLTLLVCLRSFSSAVFITISLPVSVLATFALMYFAGVSVNIMSIGGLALGVGMLVDCSIVMLECIHRNRLKSGNVFDACEAAYHEVGGSLLNGTLTTLAVLIPIMFMSGMAQRLFRDFAFTLGGSLVMSLLTAVLFLPAFMVATQRRIAHVVVPEIKPSRIQETYRALLAETLQRPWTTVLVCALLCAAGSYSVYHRGFELLPSLNIGEFTIVIKLPPDTSLERVEAAVDRVESMLKQSPDAAQFVTQAGVEIDKRGQEMAQMSGKSNEARIVVKLKPDSPAFHDPGALVQNLRVQTNSIPDTKVDFAFKQGPLARILGDRGTPELVRIVGDSLETLGGLADKLRLVLATNAVLKDIGFEGNTWVEQLNVVVERYKAAACGVSVKDVAQTVRTAVEGKQVGKLLKSDQEVDIRVRLQTKERTTVEDLRDLPFILHRDQRESEGPTVAHLGSLADVKTGKGPREILRADRRRTVSVQANVVGTTFASAEDLAVDLAKKMGVPDGYEVLPGEERAKRKASMESQVTAILLAVVLVYALLVVQFESLRWPLVVFAKIPMCIVGPAIYLYASNSPVNVLVLIGSVILVGIVVNNALLIVATINDMREGGMELVPAILEGSAIRLKPIFMTTATAVLGALPLCIAVGAGAPLNKPLALTVVSGLTTSTFFSLFLIPVVYRLFAGRDRRAVVGAPTSHRDDGKSGRP